MAARMPILNDLTDAQLTTLLRSNGTPLPSLAALPVNKRMFRITPMPDGNCFFSAIISMIYFLVDVPTLTH